MTKHIKWSSIDSLHNVVVSLNRINEVHGSGLPKVTYKAKVKLHGTNAGVLVLGGDVYAQSRTNIVTKGNFGFPEWVRENSGLFTGLPDGTVVFGEWCGRDIQKGAAVTRLETKVFAVFALRHGDMYITDPISIREMLPHHEQMMILPWYTAAAGGEFKAVIDFSDLTDPKDVTRINAEVDAVEREDPFVKENFGISGTGEGLVLYPTLVSGTNGHDTDMVTNVAQWHRLAFKAKVSKHKTVRTKKPVQVDVELAKSIDEFVDLVLPEARLEQALHEVDGEVNGFRDPKRMGPFLQWIGRDLRKETENELSAAGLTWKQVTGRVNEKARNWFFQK